MNGVVLLGLSCFACALFGAVLGAAVGGMLVWRAVRTLVGVVAIADVAEARGGSDLATQRPDSSDWQPSSPPPPDALDSKWPELTAGLISTPHRPPRRQEPVVRKAAPVQVEEQALQTLTDDEIDALPPELPAPGKPRKRIMPAPKRPTFKAL